MSQERNVWSLPTTSGIFELIVPSSAQARDFSSRMLELLRTLAVVEDRSAEDILGDFFTLGYDIQYVRMQPGGPPGTAPLRDAVGMYGAVQNMIAAVSASLEQPLPVLPLRRSAKSAEVLQKVLAGPATAGSYVVSIWTPITPRLTHYEDAVLFEMDDEPFERRTTALLHTALQSAERGASMVRAGRADISTFIDRAAEGVSANLCESLAALSGDRRTPYDVRFSWALDRPRAASDDLIRFDGDSLEVLVEAARMMRSQLPEEDVKVRGHVVRLHREVTRIGSGEVTIAGAIVGDGAERLRKFWLSLSERDYQLAIRAHEDFAEVELTGSIIQRGGRPYVSLTGPFDVLQEADTLGGWADF